MRSEVRFLPDPPCEGAIAQLGERLPCTQEVGSSILPGSTRSAGPRARRGRAGGPPFRRRARSLTVWKKHTRRRARGGPRERPLGGGAAGREEGRWPRRPGRLGLYGQANKRTRWMPRRQEATKDVAACEKPRGAGKRAMIRGCPNGETRPACRAPRPESIGAGGEPGELKHLSTRRKRNQPRFPK